MHPRPLAFGTGSSRPRRFVSTLPALATLATLAACGGSAPQPKPVSASPPVVPAEAISPAVHVAAPRTPPPPAAVANRKVLVRAPRLLDVVTGRVLEKQAIAIEGDTIVRVGDAASMPPAPDQVVIDLPEGTTALPGLIDVHTHLTSDPTPQGYEALSISIPRSALIGAKNARLTLEAGFTTVRNVGADGYADVALRDAINAGDVPGPRVIASGPPLGITGGHCDDDLLPYEYHDVAEGVADGIAAVQHKVRENIKYGADVIKICATGGVMSRGDDPQASQYTLEEMQAIVADAHRLGRKVAAHAHGAQGILWASEAGVDSIEHGSYVDDASIAVMKKNGTYLVPTVYLAEWMVANMEAIHAPPWVQQKMRVVIPEAESHVSHAIAAGVKIAFGTDSAVYPHGLNGHQFATLVRLGMKPIDALRAATTNAADLLGWSDHQGTIAPGKWADVIAVTGDPLADPHAMEHVVFVMKAGQVAKDARDVSPPRGRAIAGTLGCGCLDGERVYRVDTPAGARAVLGGDVCRARERDRAAAFVTVARSPSMALPLQLATHGIRGDVGS